MCKKKRKCLTYYQEGLFFSPDRMNGLLFFIFSDVEVDCRKFIDVGCLAFVIAALSSQYIATRETAYHVLARFMNQLEGSRFLEKTQVGIFSYD